MSQNLTEFFKAKKQQAEADQGGIDWDKRKQEWLGAVESLYSRIRELLSEPIEQGLVKISERPKTILEPHLGEYTVNELVLIVADEEVIFSPKGRNVAGAQGRVDVRGEAGEGTLVLQPGPRWSVVTSRHPQLRMVSLESDTLAELLRALTRK